jgi:hypothetical protein
MSRNPSQQPQSLVSTRAIVDLSARINKRLHAARVTKERRAATVAVLLVALSRSPRLRPGDDPDAFLARVNAAAEKVFTRAGKASLWEQIRLAAPFADSHSYARALGDVVCELRGAEVVTATGNGDLLGAFFENFLRYGNTSKDVGIVLTPRHICWLAAEALDVGPADRVYDPALGTGGFLIAAYDLVRARATPAEAERFARENLYGCEGSGPVAALAFVNLYFRGAAKPNLRNESCFNLHLAGRTPTARRAAFKEGVALRPGEHRVVTHVLMNPPFAQGGSAEPEYRFVDHALDQLRPGGLLFAVLPSSVMHAQEFAGWRTDLLAAHQLLGVVLLPGDLFYPVGVESVGVFVRKGVPHAGRKVLWARLEDGFVKWKGYRVEREGSDPREALRPLVGVARAWCVRGRAAVDRPGVYEFRAITGDELIPQAQMGTPPLEAARFAAEAGRVIRDYLYANWRSRAEVPHADGEAP